jgi:prepilin-type N-terminal cleavage/methylation domain-containing protein
MNNAKTKFPQRHAFTLVELLVVIGIIAVLIGILLPALSRARKQAALVKCLANLKQLAMGVNMYANDNQSILPYSGWRDNHQGRLGAASGRTPYYGANWLYNPGQLTNPGANKDFVPDDARTGAIWPYVEGKLTVLRCPLDDNDSVDHGGFNYLSSYAMNPLLSNTDYDDTAANPKFNGHLRTAAKTKVASPHKITEFPASAMLFWDFPRSGAIGSSGTANTGNEGDAQPCIILLAAGNYPQISGRHLTNRPTPGGDTSTWYASVQGAVPAAFLDGHAEGISAQAFHDQVMTPGGSRDLATGTSTYWVLPKDPARGGLSNPPTEAFADMLGSD